MVLIKCITALQASTFLTEAHERAGPSHVVNTAWALISLIASGADKANAGALHRGAAYLMRSQEAGGDWPQQHISGVFNRNCMITYANYRNIFPIWALGLYRRIVLLKQEYSH
jgi:cycloartenol synthase